MLLVSCIFKASDDLLETWIQTGLSMVLYIEPQHYPSASLKLDNNKNILLEILPSIQEIPWYNDQIQNLPSERNEEKDTLEHLWKMHLKLYCMYKTVLFHSSNFLGYIDFDAIHMFRNKSATIQTMMELFGNPHLFVPNPQKMYFPGCWGKLDNTTTIHNHIHWRFCGSLFFGGREAILAFYEYHRIHFSKQETIMTWEVNFWAYLEYKCLEWEPIWYAANHDDSIIMNIPEEVFGYKILADYETIQQEYDYPDLSPYRPMSAAYVDYLGKSYLNTRYVNYWIHDHGGYYFPDDEGVIRTINVCSEMDHDDSILNFNQMTNDISHNRRQRPTFSEGIEDIRLYVSQETGDLCFIGSTLGYSHVQDRIRMVRGIYDVNTHTCRDIQHLDPPNETWCEKNWAPIPFAGGDGFIYKWFPLEIGKVVVDESTGHGKLHIMVRKEMDKRFKNIKGSTSFVKYGDNGWIGVVHFSEEQCPRQYYHRVVVFESETFEVVKCSDIFCFQKASVEFCIGCRVLGNSRMGFWISRMDRDPLYIETDMKNIF